MRLKQLGPEDLLIEQIATLMTIIDGLRDEGLDFSMHLDDMGKVLHEYHVNKWGVSK